MQKLNVTKSSKENCYFIDKDHKVIQLVHPELSKLYLHSSGKDVPPYYIEKQAYLAHHGLFLNDDRPFEILKMTANDIEHYIINTSQIIFEVTDKCNFQCKYCGYGELYGNYDQRNTKNANLKDAISFIDYFFDLCKKHNYVKKEITIGFYGGEPLVNFEFIQDIIRYLETNYPYNYSYGTTTNGAFLDRYIDFLAEKKFNLLISLDGDEFSNSYRVDCNGSPTYRKVVENVNYIRKKFPSYYESNVIFFTVIHNRNIVPDVFSFFEKIFAKTPMLGRLNDGGILPEKKDLYDEMYANDTSFNYTNASTIDIISKPSLIQGHVRFLHNMIGSIYNSYIELLSDVKINEIYPTATCMPLKKKIFLTVNGKILPCEKIGHNYSLGSVSNGITHIDCEDIAERYNEMFKMIYNEQCVSCGLLTHCPTCILQSELKCTVKKEIEDEYFQSEMDFFELQQDLYHELKYNASLR